MTMRRSGILAALLLTALLFYMMPSVARSLLSTDSNRMDERLRPPRLRTLTVWLLPDGIDDRRRIARLCTAFEKEQKGVRVFLRTVTAEELTAPDAVLPDALLFGTGSVPDPRALLALEGVEMHASAFTSGVCRAVPLWLEPSVLSLPADWLNESKEAPVQASLLAHQAEGAEVSQRPPVLSPAELPWDRLLEPGALAACEGVALQQLMHLCPAARRAELAGAMGQPAAEQAHVRTLSEHLAAVRRGDMLLGCPMEPAVSDRVRYAALCRDGTDAQAFLLFLTAQAADSLADGLMPLHGAPQGDDALTQALCALYSPPVTLPNAFAHTVQELRSLCRDAFVRQEDPVITLLRLR